MWLTQRTCESLALGLVWTQFITGYANGLVTENATPEPTPTAALSGLIDTIASAMVSANVTAAVQAIAGSAAFRQGSESALAQTIGFSISRAETLYAASNQSGITLSLLGAPYHPYNVTAAAARAETLGQALYKSSTPSSFTGQAFADAFIQSFQTQTGPLQSVYGGFSIAAGSLVAAYAANQSQAYGQMFSQAKSSGVAVSNISSVLGQVMQVLPNNGAAAVSAANQAYGATVQSLNATAGNTTAVAMLIQNSIALDAHALDVSISILAGSNTSQLYGPPFDTTNATAIRIADAIKGSNVTTDNLNAALVSAIAEGLTSGLKGGAAIAVETAVYAGHAQAVMTGVAQGKAANVSTSNACASQIVAQAHSTEAGQAAVDAITAAYGSGAGQKCSVQG